MKGIEGKSLEGYNTYAAQDKVIRAGELDDSLATEIAFETSLSHCLWHGLDVETAEELCQFWKGLKPEDLRSGQGGETETEKGVGEKLRQEVPPRLLLEFLNQGIISGEAAQKTYERLGFGYLWRDYRGTVEERRRGSHEYIRDGKLLAYFGTFDLPHTVHTLEMALGAAMALNLPTTIIVDQSPKKGAIADFPDRQEMVLAGLFFPMKFVCRL